LSSNTTGSGNIAISPRNSAGTYAPVFDPITEIIELLEKSEKLKLDNIKESGENAFLNNSNYPHRYNSILSEVRKWLIVQLGGAWDAR
jgi:hypothetical protein